MDISLVFYLLLFTVAFLYASVGHGGASGYLALMAIYGFAPDVMKPTALLLNLFVSITAFIQFYRGKHFNWKIFLPLAVASVPMAFLGGLVSIDAVIYKKILGALLLIPVARFFFFKNTEISDMRPSSIGLSVLIGAVIGLLSGMIGIGGGIILSPVLLLLKWTDQKQTAAISALFIFVNSLSGLFGQLTKGISFSSDMLLMVLIAFGAGFLGAWLGSLKFRQDVLKFILASVLSLAAFKLLFTGA
ncbi:sulfite exporter TauE/SafE family protein [Flavihumibacter profundi]|uniref:sulfite exporter TauE/SafE family protein n=1 Tax=Flavihumibacter profundi TaxID=2716883 RepID=UPI001CC7B164|nr:sulfite exporter TauE/SafE family protein [Flavihumibacter profundi]MBZ5858326.1 sulfite exporter TauE/SafE family protein [Flavihumibacter profundi]